MEFSGLARVSRRKASGSQVLLGFSAQAGKSRWPSPPAAQRALSFDYSTSSTALPPPAPGSGQPPHPSSGALCGGSHRCRGTEMLAPRRRGGSALRRRRPSVGGAASAPRPPTPLARSAARVSPPLPLSRNLRLTTLPNYSYPSLSSQRRCQGWRGFRSEPLLPCRHLRGHQASGFSLSEPPGHQLPTAAVPAARRRGHDPRAPAPGDCSGAGVPGTLPAPWASERLSKKGRRDPHPLGRLPLGSPRSAPRLQPFSQIQLGSRELSRSCSHPDPT